ncbi:hypothetical protein Anas_13744, partial [Armadillidium nasatum]
MALRQAIASARADVGNTDWFNMKSEYFLNAVIINYDQQDLVSYTLDNQLLGIDNLIRFILQIPVLGSHSSAWITLQCSDSIPVLGSLSITILVHSSCQYSCTIHIYNQFIIYLPVSVKIIWHLYTFGICPGSRVDGGRKNILADALSRSPVPAAEDEPLDIPVEEIFEGNYIPPGFKQIIIPGGGIPCSDVLAFGQKVQRKHMWR